MSIVLVTPDSLETLGTTIRHLRAQTAKDRLEIVVVAPSTDGFDKNDLASGGFARVEYVEIGVLGTTAEARAAGIRRATAPVVALVEDHSFPDPDWAEALIAAHRQDWAVVGPEIVCANPDSIVSWANLLLEYGEWLAPAEAGSRKHLPGHNSSYKRVLLLEYGERLGELLEAESVLHWDLTAKGHALNLDPRAKVRHLNFSRLSSTLPLRFNGGRAFAAARARRWSVVHRLAYAVGAFWIPLIRLSRIVRSMRRPGSQIPSRLRILPTLGLVLAVDAIGEFFGYVGGVGSAQRRLTGLEFHRERYLNEQDKRMVHRGFSDGYGGPQMAG